MTQKLFKTGEFAKLCNTTKDTLFHYDDIGLLKPVQVAGNGYRYYSANQIYIFDLIATLKEVGLGLNEIKAYMQIRDTENFLIMLKDKDAMLKKEQEQLRRRRKLLANTIKITEASYVVEENKIEIIERDDEYFIISNPVHGTNEKVLAEVLGEHLQYCVKYNYYDDFATGEIIAQKNISNNSFATSFFFSRIDKIVKSKYFRVKPAGKYAVKYIRGSYADLPAEYKLFCQELRSLNLIIDGDIYQEDITNYFSERDVEDYLMKLEVRIK